MNITEIQRFCMHDGPGIRTVVFLKGCPLRCAWCHNPETQSAKQEILFFSKKCIGCGQCVQVCESGAHRMTDQAHIFDRSLCIGCLKCTQICCSRALTPAFTAMSVDEVLKEVLKDRAFFGETGGVTVSGGEPLLQSAEVTELLRKCKKNGIGTAVETCGYFDGSILPALIPLTDRFLWDFKDGNDESHRKYTGVSHKKIIENLLYADTLGANTVLRCILVNGVNMTEEHCDAIAGLWRKLRHCAYVELIPYHAYGGSKMLPLGKADNGHPEWIPEECAVFEFGQNLRKRGVNLK